MAKLMVRPLDEDNVMSSPIKILRLRDVQTRIGISRPTIYRWLDSDPSFPRPVKIGSRSIGWIESEVNQWLEARILSSRTQGVS